MAVTFPNSPTLGEEYTAENGLIYIWDGEKWKTQGSYAGDQGLYILKDGSNTALYADDVSVGIGTTTPGSLLHLSGVDPEIQLTDSDSGGADHKLSGSGTNLVVRVDDNNEVADSTFRVYVDGSEKLRVDDAGNVGVGTSSPDKPFVVNSTSANTRQFYVGEGSNSNYTEIGAKFYDNSSKGYLDIHGYETNFYTQNKTQALTIDADGLVGINQPVPTSRLDIGGDLKVRRSQDNDQYVQITATSTGSFVASNSDTNPKDFFVDNNQPDRSLNIRVTDTGGSKVTVLSAANGSVKLPPAYSSTTANAANVYIASDGRVYRSTSAAKYKTDVTPIDPAVSNALLDIPAITYRSLGTTDNPDWTHYGFIAEDVEQVDPRLVSYGVVEGEEEPELEGVQYERFVPHLLLLVKEQKEAIAALEARVAELEGN